MKRFFLRGLIDEHVRLTPEQVQAVHKDVMKRFGAEPRANLLRMVPGMLPLIAIPFWQPLRKQYGVLIEAGFEVLFTLVVLSLVWWMFRRAYTRHARRVIRDCKFANICGECGYDLTGVSLTRSTCPECGAPITGS